MTITMTITITMTPTREERRLRRQRGALALLATATRYDSVACDERNFSSSEERALAHLGLSAQPLGRWPKGKAKELRLVAP